MNIFRHLSPKKAILGLIAVVGLIFAGTFAVQNTALAGLPQDCQNNSIIKCGVQTKEELRDKYNNSAELRNLYAHPFNGSVAGYGLQNADMERLVREGKQGLAYKDGRITVEGQLVATGATSLGRYQNNAGRQPVNVAGTTYYYGLTSISYGPNTDSLPIFAIFTEEGELEYAVITACGNPVWGNNIKPEYDCKNLQATPVAGKQNTYNFTTETFEDKGANVVKVAYNFNDGTPIVENTNKAGKFAQEHAFTKPGKYKVTVTITVNLPGGKTKTFTREYCQKEIEVKEPVYKCEALAGKLISGNRKYRFELKATAKDGAKLTSVDFDFGDGQKATGIKPPVETGTIAMSIDHQYAAELFGKKTITAELTFNLGQETKKKQCSTEIDLKKETCADKPNAPECQPPVKYCKPGIPEGDDRCKDILPKEIVKTGPAEIAASALGLSAVAGAGMYYRASRRTFVDTLLKRK